LAAKLGIGTNKAATERQIALTMAFFIRFSFGFGRDSLMSRIVPGRAGGKAAPWYRRGPPFSLHPLNTLWERRRKHAQARDARVDRMQA
jgi:hypothetical protein